MKSRDDKLEDPVANYFNNIIEKAIKKYNLYSGFFAHNYDDGIYFLDRTILNVGSNDKPMNIGFNISSHFDDKNQEVSARISIPYENLKPMEIEVSYHDSDIANKLEKFIMDSMELYVDITNKLESEGLK